uniref:Uncharacterized protein n=1 Tax=Panagrolaimus sp. PS1159 TaxID=55785 RepID=A0AC35GLB7_9BILA
MRYSKTRSHEKYLNTVAVFFNEIVKLIVSLIIFILLSKSIKCALKDLKYHFITNFLDSFKVGIPALIYTIQNILLYVAIEHLETSTFMITYQIKILTTATFAVLILKTKLSAFQWISLFALIAGIILVQSNANQTLSQPSETNFTSSYISNNTVLIETIKEINENKSSPIFGLLMVILACILSGFAGIYFEKILKNSDVSLWIRSIQLSFFSLPCCAILIGIKDYDAVIVNGFMQGFDFLVWNVVLIHAAGGLIVSIVIKYADNILKAFATSLAIFIAIIITTSASVLYYNIWPSIAFIIGAILVISAVIVYGLFPYQSTQKESIIIKEVPLLQQKT